MIEFLIAMQSAVVSRVKSVGRKSDEGATAVEYGLMVALIAGVIIVAVTALGNNVSESFTDTCESISATVDPGTSCTETVPAT